MGKKIHKKSSFRNRIFRIMIGISLVPLIVISFNSLYTVVKTRQQNISELQMTTLNNVVEKIHNFVLNQGILGLKITGNIKEIEPRELQDLINTIKLSDPNNYIKDLAFIDEFGSELRSYPERELNYVKGKEFFQKAFLGNIYFGDVEYRDGVAPIIRLSAPLHDSGEKIAGVVSVIISIEPLINELKTIKLGNTGYVYVVDQSGRLIANSSEHGEFGEDLKDNVLVERVMMRNIRNGMDSEDVYINSRGEKVIFAGKPVDMSDSRGYILPKWFVISEWPDEDAFAVTRDIMRNSIIIIMISMALVILFAVLLTRRIVRPIEALKKGTEEVSKGNLDYKVSLPTNDEFEILGENFNKMAQVLKDNNRLREEFVFIAAHELRTPVTAIKGYLSMVLDGSFGEVSDKVRENLYTVSQANERLVQLVHDLLEVARSDAGKMTIKMTPLVIGENVKSIVAQLKGLADEKKIKIKYNKKFANEKVMADSYKINEVIVNTLGNAIKYTTDHGEIEISHEKDGNKLITHIKDHGLGMSEEDMGKLFEKFYRVQTVDTEKIEGTGLGLFICKEIIERMGGHIWAESKLGVGSTFSFSLKIAK